MNKETTYQDEVDGYFLALKKKPQVEVERLLQMMERERYEYEEAKRLIEHYELFNNDAMIAACKKILKEK